MTYSRLLPRIGLAGLFFGLILAAQARVSPTDTEAEIRRTTFGVPHISAQNERGLGYGIGYAYAQDNLCLLANEIVTVNGERAKFFGAEQRTLEQRPNLASDVFFQWLNGSKAVAAFWRAQPDEVRQLMDGYVAGYNRQLAERGSAGLPVECQAAWVRPITTDDLVKLTRRLLAEGGAGQFVEALAGATPPQATAQRVSAPADFQLAAERQQRFALDRGSNAVAVGGERSFNGRGLLLANPHFPWGGGLRFYQMHLSIPGKLDVMGASLPGLPLINIGFSQHLAWTHTVDSSKHFTLYRLTLDPKDPTRYLLDGRSRPLTRQTVVVESLQPDGSLARVERVVYSSPFGPVVQWPGRLDWSPQFAYSLRDANLDNDRVLQQWYAMNQAASLEELQASVHRLQGIPWVNTLAVDDRGQALYMNQSVVPHVDAAQMAQCSDPRAGLQLIVLDGSRSACAWGSDPKAAQKGIFAAERLPQLQRGDFVQHSNDSAWLANPAAPLTGFSPLISQDGQPLGLRARFALDRLGRLDRPGAVGVSDLQQMVMDDQVYLADLLLADVLQFCAAQQGSAATAVEPACSQLKRWDRGANLHSGLGFVYFQKLVEALQPLDGRWRVAFDPRDPRHTPNGLAIERPPVAEALRGALVTVTQALAQSGLPADTRWGDLQQVSAGGQAVPIHGGPQALGVYNAMQSVAGTGGKREVVSGTSYLQVVSFEESGPKALGVLAFSLSSDPSSPHFRDQTQAFSDKQWHTMPFTRAQIEADPAYRLQRIAERDGQHASTASH